ncbi:MAG: hypothetical protein AAB927_01405 [Patescibacteria group bacterium]
MPIAHRVSVAAISLAFLLPMSAAAANSELHFTPDGTFTAKNVVIYQKAGTNFFSRAVWGTTFLRFVIVTSTSTVITKKYGESATAADIKEQDIIDITGSLAQGGDSMVINAKTIRDMALQTAGKTFSGVVVSVDSGGQTFVLNEKTTGKTNVAVGGATITKGVRTITSGELRAGDKVLSASGTYSYSTNTLNATSVSVYQDDKLFKPRNFEGILKSISGTALPVTAVVTVGATDYTVYVPVGAPILKNSRAATVLSRFVAGDKVRFYGAIRPTNFTEVAAEILRDLNF